MKLLISTIFLGYALMFAGANVTSKSIMWLEHNTNLHEHIDSENADLCHPCVDLINNGIEQFLNVILKGGVVGSCNELCTKAFPDNENEEKVCNMLCDAVGVYAFIDLVKKYSGYLDSIYFCESLKMCPVHEGGVAKLDNITVTPASGPVGTTFEIQVLFTVLNQTSTGELSLSVTPPHSNTFGDSMVDSGFAPGQYGVRFNLKASPTEEEPFEAGSYKVTLLGCDGECGSKLPHTATLFEGEANFTITAA